MRENGIDLQALKHDQGMDDVDDFDFICHIAYGKKPLTRKERAENVKKHDVFHKYGPEAQKVLEALLDKYMNEGISQLENRKVLTLDPFRQMGSPSGIAKLFGGNQQYMAAVKELEDSIYNDIAMRNDAGINGDAQRIEQIAWMLFLKVYDEKENDWEFNEDNYTSFIPENCRWRNWAKDDGTGEALTADNHTRYAHA